MCSAWPKKGFFNLAADAGTCQLAYSEGEEGSWERESLVWPTADPWQSNNPQARNVHSLIAILLSKSVSKKGQL
jgi:hypothetical protein